ncbi:MAG: hypothetical protein PVJ19_22235 [Desulfobacteraceae bacterium]|jgi:hypothetical protein
MNNMNWIFAPLSMPNRCLGVKRNGNAAAILGKHELLLALGLFLGCPV